MNGVNMSKFISLYSGSSGNCSVVLSGERYLLIDMGKSCRITVNALKELGLRLSDCQGILVTHEHTDHVKGLQTFLKKYAIPVYGRADTLDNLEAQGILPSAAETIAMLGRTEDIGGFVVSCFPTSHDVPCCGYRIRTPDGSVMAMCTDLGYISPAVHEALSGCSLVALEANYDLQSLMNGPYPYHLKVRIRSQHGHLDNRESAAKILELLQEGCKKIALCHLSEQNNTPNLVLSEIKRALDVAEYVPGEDVTIQVQRRNEPSDPLEF